MDTFLKMGETGNTILIEPWAKVRQHSLVCLLDIVAVSTLQTKVGGTDTDKYQDQ